MIFSVKFGKAVSYGKQMLGPILERGGQRLRRTSNRLTTYAIRREYFSGLKGYSYTLSGMLGKMRPSEFGPKEKTAFIAAHGCEKVVDKFLFNTGYSRTLIELKKFRNGESYARIRNTIRDKTVVLFQDFEKGNINDTLMETLFTIDAAKRASARQVVLICPSLPYLEDPAGTPNYDVDYFKLALNLLFKAANLDELRFGNVVLDREKSYLFLQDIIFSRRIAPFMIAQSEHFAHHKVTDSEELIFFAGKYYGESAQQIIDQLNKKYEIKGQLIDLGFSYSGKNQKISLKNRVEMNLSGKTAYIFQTCNTGRINDDFMEALLMIYTARKRGAKKIVLVMPYLPYNRQERKAKTREAISAKVVANALVEAAGTTQMITLDLHAPATQGFVDIPFQHATAFQLIARFVRDKIRRYDAATDGWLGKNLIPFSPDVGRAKMARKMGLAAIGPGFDFGVIGKYRPRPGEAKVAMVIGDVQGRDVLFIDDMCDSAGTLITGAEAAHEEGAARIYVALIHGVFSDVAIELYDKQGKKNKKAFEELENIRKFLKKHKKRIKDFVKKGKNKKTFIVNALIRLQAHPHIEGIVFTDSLNVPESNIVDYEKIKQISIINLLAMVCGKIMSGKSLQDYQYEGK